jgi:hypothetical protein
MAGKSHILLAEKHTFLPPKIGQTSVVTILQHPHNVTVEVPRTLLRAQNMDCEQRANYILDCHLPVANSSFRAERAVVERRSKPRSTNAFPARVWGVDIDDQPFSVDCHLDNISGTGLYLRMPRRMKFSSAISLVVRLWSGPFEAKSAAIKGLVIRDETWPDGHSGVGIRIVEHRFI